MLTVSIVTVVYNRPKDLERTILSCIKQDYVSKEYIIVDGGSTDGTIDVIKKYEDKISLWKSEPDKGIFNAMNKSLEMVSGDYVIFMNAGDVFYSSNVLSSIFLNHDRVENIIYGDSILHNKNGFKYRKTSSIYEKNASIRDYVYKGQGICHQAIFTKIDILKTVKFDEKYVLGADYDTTAKIIKSTPGSCLKLSFPICVFDDVSGGASHGQLKKVIDERLKMFNYKKDWYYYYFLYINELLVCLKNIISFLFPWLKRRYLSNQYSKSIEELCV